MKFVAKYHNCLKLKAEINLSVGVVCQEECKQDLGQEFNNSKLRERVYASWLMVPALQKLLHHHHFMIPLSFLHYCIPLAHKATGCHAFTINMHANLTPFSCATSFPPVLLQPVVMKLLHSPTNPCNVCALLKCIFNGEMNWQNFAAIIHYSRRNNVYRQ